MSQRVTVRGGRAAREKGRERAKEGTQQERKAKQKTDGKLRKKERKGPLVSSIRRLRTKSFRSLAATRLQWQGFVMHCATRMAMEVGAKGREEKGRKGTKGEVEAKDGEDVL